MPNFNSNVKSTYKKCSKQAQKNGNIPIATIGKVKTNRNNGTMTDIQIRTDGSSYGLLMGCYPGHRKFITGLVTSCRDKQIHFVIEDKTAVMNLAKYSIALKETELSPCLLKDPEIMNIISN